MATIKKSRFGQLLLKKEVIDKSTLEKALLIQTDEDPEHTRALGEILVTDFKINHHAIYGLLAELYAFRTIDIKVNEIDESQIKHTKEILSKLPDDFKQELIYKKILPYQLS